MVCLYETEIMQRFCQVLRSTDAGRHARVGGEEARVTTPYYLNNARKTFLGASRGWSGAPIERGQKKKKKDLAIMSALGW
jgi:hypothetical protein